VTDAYLDADFIVPAAPSNAVMSGCHVDEFNPVQTASPLSALAVLSAIVVPALYRIWPILIALLRYTLATLYQPTAVAAYSSTAVRLELARESNDA